MRGVVGRGAVGGLLLRGGLGLRGCMFGFSFLSFFFSFFVCFVKSGFEAFVILV